LVAVQSYSAVYLITAGLPLQLADTHSTSAVVRVALIFQTAVVPRVAVDLQWDNCCRAVQFLRLVGSAAVRLKRVRADLHYDVGVLILQARLSEVNARAMTAEEAADFSSVDTGH
jgi:hypothetical protein